MKGVVLAAGKGTRLRPLTLATPKCLLPVYDKPMIYYSLEKLVEAGINDVLLITGVEHKHFFKMALNYDKSLNVNLSYKTQCKPRGPGDALKLAEEFSEGENIVLIFGDNIFEESITTAVENFTSGAHVFLKQVKYPERYGIAEIKNKKIVKITEKPKKPKTNYAVIGCYIYDSNVFDNLRKVMQKNGELGITDLNKIYVKQKKITHTFLKNYWTDAGTIDSLLEANFWAGRK